MALCENSCAGREASIDILTELPHVIIGKIWPSDRVVLGQRVCKALKQNLSRSVPIVSLQANGSYERWDQQAILEDFISLSEFGAKLELHCMNVRNFGATQKLIGALKAASDCGTASSLVHLDLKEGMLGNLPPADLQHIFKGCGNLKFLDLSLNRIMGMLQIHTILGLETCTSLEHFIFRKNYLPIAAQLAQGLRACTRLQHLDLSECDINHQNVDGLAAGLIVLSSLSHLDLKCNKIGDSVSFADALASCPRLTLLGLASNKISGSGATRIAKSLSHCSALQHLDMSLNPLTASGAEVLVRALNQSTALRVLKLEGTNLRDAGARHLGGMRCPELRELYLEANRIYVDGAEGVARLLRTCPKLEVLAMYRNEIGAEGGETLAAVLGSGGGTSLAKLALNEAKMRDEGVQALAAALVPCVRLSEVNLWGNEMTDAGLAAVARSLPLCRLLQVLDLSFNRITDSGATALAELLASNTCVALAHLCVRQNRIGERGAERLVIAAGDSRSLRRLDIGDNMFEENGEVIAALKVSCGVEKVKFGHKLITWGEDFWA